jgi:Sulfotransferase family
VRGADDLLTLSDAYCRRLQQGFQRSDDALDILVLGSGRSGTTWVQEVLSALPGYRIVFEPFHQKNVRHFPQVGDYERLYQRKERSDGVLADYLRRLTREALPPGSPLSREQSNLRIKAYQTVIKSIRLNLSAGWLREHFQGKLVFVLRDPVGVIRSWLTTGWGQRRDVGVYLRQSELVNDYLLPCADYLQWLVKKGTVVERSAACWVIENGVAVRMLEQDVVSYDEMVAEPVAGWEHLLAKLELPVPSFLDEIVGRPSSTTIGVPKQRLDKEQENAIREVVTRLGFEELIAE